MNRHALEVLEFADALEQVASRASSDPGREAVRALRPSPRREEVQEELERVGQVVVFLEERHPWAPPPIPDPGSALRRLDVDGNVLEPGELHTLGALLRASRLLRKDLGPALEDAPLLGPLRERLVEDREREEAIEETVEADGTVLDSASRELAAIRKRLRTARSRIVERLDAFMASLDERHRVSDASVSVREGRYVIPIRREGRREVGGIVHGESGTGATLFVEPPLALELMNEIKELEAEEAREIHRILRGFSRALRPERALLAGSQEALVAFDSLYARARAAREWEGHVPELLPADARELTVVRGRHPLLLVAEEDVVPFDLHLEPGERALVVSGPNTGGKTVFLKALGLGVTLAQSGVVPPVGPGTRLPAFSDVFADIGDEQSIAESLSTFSAHLANLKEIVEGADGTSLVLMDEMGTGTDPAEGAVLARAILEELVERGALSVVTSHLGALKRLDAEGSGIVNASLQFDAERMEPTYRLIKGRPGRSYGLAIARRLGFPGTVLDRAEGHLSQGEASVDDLLEKLEEKEQEAETLVSSLEEERKEAARLRSELQAREAELRERERTAERRAREDARQLLMEAREEVEEAIREVREVADEAELEAVSRRARGRVEEAARRQRERRPEREEAPVEHDFEPGERVRVRGSGARGEVVELRDDRAVVETSGLRLKVALTELEPEEGGEAARRSAGTAADGSAGGDRNGAGGWTGPAVDPSTEVDLRGLRVDEVERELSRALDGAVLGDLSELRVIHGKGTGALRARVQELLGGDGRVGEFRTGRPGEGGTGVTVVSIR